MEIGGKNRWKISFYRSSSRVQKEPPPEFICPISSSLMADPVIVSSGQTFERACAQACRDLGFVPLLSDGSRPEFSALIPNRALKSAILNWCNLSGSQLPNPLEPHVAIELVRTLVEAAEKGKKEEAEVEKTQEGIQEKKAVLTETLKGKDEEDEIEKTQKGIHEEETILKEAEKEEKEEDEKEKTHKGVHGKEAVLRETEERKDEEVEIEKTQNGIHEENPRTKKEKNEEGETEKTHIGIHKKEKKTQSRENSKRSPRERARAASERRFRKPRSKLLLRGDGSESEAQSFLEFELGRISACNSSPPGYKTLVQFLSSFQFDPKRGQWGRTCGGGNRLKAQKPSDFRPRRSCDPIKEHFKNLSGEESPSLHTPAARSSAAAARL